MIPEFPNISLRKAALGFLLLVGVTVIMLVILKAAGIERLQSMVAEIGPWAPAVYVALKASTYIVAPLSGSPLHVSAGALFGLSYGTLYSLTGDVIGGCANFWISRLLGRRMVVRESVPVPALLMSQVLCCRRCPFDPLTWRTRLETSLVGCKARKAPALPDLRDWLRGWRKTCLRPASSHTLLAIVGYRMIIGCLGFDRSVSP